MKATIASATHHGIMNTEISQHMLDLLKQLTLEEKVAMLSGADFSTTVGIPRLNIASLKLSDSTSASKGASLGNPVPTACFPNTTALAASWDKDLIEEMGKSAAGQAKYKAAQVLLGPSVNMQRDPRAGRNFETFSEDPVLTGQLAAALVRGIQSQDVAACLKHFVANDSDTLRKKYNSIVDPRTLREIYLAPFQCVVREANPAMIMTAYNKVNGTYTSETPMIKDVLRDEWGYQGSIMSDWYGTESRITALEAGLDLEMPGPSKMRGKPVLEDIRLGRISTEVIDQRVLGILKLVARTSKVHSTSPEEAGQNEATSALIRKIASESMVLLKNENNLLPLDIESAPTMAIIGLPSVTYCTGGGSASGLPQYYEKPYDCIKKVHPKPDRVGLSLGVKTHKCIPMISSTITRAKNGKHGVDVVYYNNGVDEPVLTEFQPPAIVFMLGHLKPGLKETGFTYHMTTNISPETDGLHTLAVLATGAFELFIDDKLVLSKVEPDMIVEDYLFDPKTLEIEVSISMKATQSYSVKLIVQSRKQEIIGEPTLHSAKLCFLEEFSDTAAIAEAATLAAKSEVSVVCVGRNAEWESEGSDMHNLDLPRAQTQLIQAVAKACPKTVVVLFGGSPFDVSPWISSVDAVLLAHYPGQEAGTALTDVLTGIVNPSGKLSATWPMNLESIPTLSHFPAKASDNGPVIEYKEGLKIGYRYYWSKEGEGSARWDFGYGLSYTHFKYDGLKAVRKVVDGQENVIDVEVTVENDGPVAGAEVVQVYVEDVEASVWRPAKELKAFDKVFLKSGEKKVVKVQMRERDACSFWDVKSNRWVAEKGEFRIHVADKLAAVVLEESLSWSGL